MIATFRGYVRFLYLTDQSYLSRGLSQRNCNSTVVKRENCILLFKLSLNQITNRKQIPQINDQECSIKNLFMQVM